MRLGIDVFRKDPLECLGEFLEVLRGEVRVKLDALLGFLLVDGVLEELSLDAHDDAREHLDEAAIGVPGEALVVGLLDESLDRLVVEAEVEDGIHHARHGERST